LFLTGTESVDMPTVAPDWDGISRHADRGS